jgi:hypothetical protein
MVGSSTLERGASEHSAGQVAACATQISSGVAPRWGSGGASAFEVKFVSISIIYKRIFMQINWCYMLPKQTELIFFV